MTDLALADTATIEAVPDRTRTLDIVSARVADVENQLARLDQLVSDEAKHQAEIARLADEKSQILENRDLDKQQRITKVGKILAAVEVESADLARKKSEISAQHEHIREVGITARGFMSHVFDQLRASRLTRAEAFVTEFFYQRPLGLQAKDVAQLSNLHREVDLLSYGLHPKPNLSLELAALRELPTQWSVIRGLCEKEEGFAPELPESWL